MKHPLTSCIKPCHNYIFMTTRYITICACEMLLFRVEKYHYAFMNIRKESNGEFAFVIISKHGLLGVFEFQQKGNVLFFAL